MTLSYASDSGAARNNCQQGAIARERSDQAGRVLKGFSPSHDREILLLKIILCMKTAYHCTLNAIIRGRLCEVA